LGWYPKQAVSDSLKIESLPIVREAEALEPVDQVVSKQDQVKIGLIGGPVSGGNLAQGIGFEKFPNDKFSRSSLVVEAPEIERF
jgi:hypothetical protein